MKKIALFLTFMLSFGLLAGCAGISTSSHSINQTFDYRNQEDVTQITVGAGQKSFEMRMEWKVKAGSVHIALEDPNGKTAYEMSADHVKSQQTIQAVPGVWKVRLTTIKAEKGSIHINFEF